MPLPAASYAQRANGVGLQVLGTRPPDVQPLAGQPLESRPPNGVGQKAAFPGQTRIGAVITKTPYEEKLIAQRTQSAVGLCVLA